MVLLPALALPILPPGPELAGAVGELLDLLPIPAALLRDRADRLVVEVDNSAFRALDTGTDGVIAALMQMRQRIQSFLVSAEPRCEFALQAGEPIHRRFFRVVLARQASATGGGYCLATLIDETAERRTEDSLRREMSTDSLTGLPNRTAFSDLLEAAISPDTSEKIAVLVVDVNRFNQLNACMGGLAGDELLISLARRLKGVLRADDTLARTGGDEFGILLRLTSGSAEAKQVARRIEQALSTPFRLSAFETRVTCAIGIALGVQTLTEPEDLIRKAQFAVKRAKNSGHPELYQTRAFDAARARFGMETELRRALDAGALRLCYQPICDLATGRIVAFEALARWRDESGRDVPPTEFIAVAEESDLILPLGRWALSTAARTLAGWDERRASCSDIRVAVNISAIQLQRDDVAAMVSSTLADTGLAGERLTLELTESAFIADPERTGRTLRALKALGTTLALDDFGTGYSNLAHLQKLPIDVLKIDRSFVTGMLADRDKVAIVRAVLSLAQTLNLRTTAEGLESTDLVQTLAALGCTYGQGFAVSGALEADAAYSLLLASQSATATSASSSTRSMGGNASATH